MVMVTLVCLASFKTSQSNTHEINGQMDVTKFDDQYSINTFIAKTSGHLTTTISLENLLDNSEDGRVNEGQEKLKAERQIEDTTRREYFMKQRNYQKPWTRIDPASLGDSGDNINFRINIKNAEVGDSEDNTNFRINIKKAEVGNSGDNTNFRINIKNAEVDEVVRRGTQEGERWKENRELEKGGENNMGHISHTEVNNMRKTNNTEKNKDGYSVRKGKNRENTKLHEQYDEKNDIAKNSVTMNKTTDSAQIKDYDNKVDQVENYKYKDYDVKNPFEYKLFDDTKQYFIEVGDLVCFRHGTDLNKTQASTKCHCVNEYFGVDCGIPAAAWFSMYKNKYPETKLIRRKIPRRIINGLPVNHEYAMFEARVNELHDTVDVFIVGESNYTAHGDAKALTFLNRFRQGYLAQFQDKIVYVNLTHFPKLSEESGWIADAYLRFHLGDKGQKLVKGIRDDDLFVLSDADELPTCEILTFLKIYDGYPEPVRFALQWNVFGFFWKEPIEESIWNFMRTQRESITEVTSVATIGMLRDVLYNNAYYIRKEGLWQYHKMAKKVRHYREEGHLLKEWTAGAIGHYAGWHCSWCFSPENMLLKLDSAQVNDVPRWGDFPEKRNLTYIASRITKGIWFDNKKRFVAAKRKNNPHYAPKYFMDHPHLYRSILFHPSHQLNHNKPWMPP